MKTFHLIITSVSGAKFDGAAVSATVPGAAGEMTLLPGHEPLMTTLKAGTITARIEGGEAQTFAIEDGVLECTGDTITILL